MAKEIDESLQPSQKVQGGSAGEKHLGLWSKRRVRQTARTSVGWQGRSAGCVKSRGRVLFCLLRSIAVFGSPLQTNSLNALMKAQTVEHHLLSALGYKAKVRLLASFMTAVDAGPPQNEHVGNM